MDKAKVAVECSQFDTGEEMRKCSRCPWHCEECIWNRKSKAWKDAEDMEGLDE